MKIEYKKQARLAISVLQHIAKEQCFALKGGSAINFFLYDVPRLSVDIDLSYIEFSPRNEAIANINAALGRALKNLGKSSINFEISIKDDNMQKINCFNDEAEVKIDINYIARGYAYEPIIKPISPKIRQDYEFVEMKILSIAELYGGKICAALNRQHPRDLFDIKILFENEGITEYIKNGFIVCMLGDNGAPYELLAPKIKDQRKTLDNSFNGMTDRPFSYQDHESALQELIKTLHKSLTDKDKEFIISFFSLNPKWELNNIPNLQKLPA
ncbi:MAG: nucleotidyl transferase AbiEii/AbiGii toxin family protein, partial [Endomicrobium sp.]|nr:nucleotidyl transferase AbiEii/AbiGii toxin family protein [Endomicrobium sp.]